MPVKTRSSQKHQKHGSTGSNGGGEPNSSYSNNNNNTNNVLANGGGGGLLGGGRGGGSLSGSLTSSRGSWASSNAAHQQQLRHNYEAAYYPRRIRHRNKWTGYLLETWELYKASDSQLHPAQLVRLGEHRYTSVDVSWLDELCMKRFWDNVVSLYPIWLAPNLITLIGLVINLCTVLVLSHFCFSATETAPSWAYLQAALGLFVYQTLDATDGKQARRTGTSSPLGELFDHGCDSMTQVFVTLNICYAMQMGQERNMAFATTLVALAIFYCAHWSTYCTGQLRFSRFDVTEAQMVVIGVLLATGVFGPGIWSVAIFGIRLRLLVIYTCFVFALWQLGGYLRVVLSEGIGKNGSTVAGTSVIYPVCPLLFVVLPFTMLYCKSTSGIFDRNITLLLLCFGAVAAKATNRLVIAYMSRSSLELWDWIYMSPFVMILNQYYDFHFNEYHLLVISTIYAYASLVIFCWATCRQLCDFLDIYCFRISPNCANSSSGGGGNQPMADGGITSPFAATTTTSASPSKQHRRQGSGVSKSAHQA